VLAARDGSETEARGALESLCQTYWSPLYAYARSLGHDADEASDLTQGFFAYLVEKEILQSVDPAAGRFRSFLFASIKHFIAHHHRRERALKRGGGTTTISLDSRSDDERLAGLQMDTMTPEQVFEYRWGLTVLERALSRLQSEWSDETKARLFESLKPHLTGQEPRIPFREIAVDLEMTDVAVRGAMYRLRQRYGQLIRLEIEETVADSADVDDEVRHLLSVIGPWETKQQ
jgi:RNA polymerase sigma-70 factor (ECF subfamily)